MAGVENWLPAFDVGERHETKIALPPKRALQRALATPAAPDAFIRFLFRLRGRSPDGSIERFMATNGFVVLERTARTYVVGLVARRARLVPVRDSVGRREIDRPYSLKIAADFRAEPAPEGARLITETRVAATSFWALVVFPFSALIVVAGFGRRPARRQDSDRRMTSTFPRRLNVHFLGFAVWVRRILGMGQAAGSNQHS